MIAKETFEESCEYPSRSVTALKPFTVRVYETEEIYQDVIAYVSWFDNDVADVFIMMPLYVIPSGIRDDVSASLWSEHRRSLAGLAFDLVPQNQLIAP